jgi:E3 SUMO-protein ligase NSE2
MPEASASRGHRHRHRDQERVSRIPTLPEYQPLTAPLNPAGQRALAALVQGGSFRRLHAHLQHAAEKLTETAGEAIERATDARVRYERQRKRRAENKEDGDDADQDEDKNEDEDNSNDEESKKLIQLEERVQDVTDKLEEKMRRVIDAEVKLAALEKTIGLLSREANDAGNASQGREANNVNEEEGDSSDEAKQEPAKAIQPLTDKLAAKLAQDRAEWEALSLTKRYCFPFTLVLSRPFYRVSTPGSLPPGRVI